jgi:Domain of unknown function (DUF2760)
MSRIGLAFASFFGLLFRGRLPPEVVPYLPPEALPPPTPALPPAAPVAPRSAPVVASAEAPGSRAEGALLLLGLLQREGRLVDFLRESLDRHPDAAIGAAVRDVHRGCRKVLDDHVRLEPVMPGQEEGPVVVPRGFDPTEVRLIGMAGGEPPFRGTLVHHGWRAVDVKLPTLADGLDRRVVAPAEVRLSDVRLPDVRP